MKVFEELATDSCRWPLFDCNLPGEKGVFLFCGECAARSGLPYCREHMVMAYKLHRAMRPPVARLQAHESARQVLIAIAAAVAA
jgi:hypothetical protein